jgi:hypothetical protein
MPPHARPFASFLAGSLGNRHSSCDTGLHSGLHSGLHALTGGPAMRAPQPCPARAAALDLLQGFALPEACNIESWLDRIEARNGREARP